MLICSLSRMSLVQRYSCACHFWLRLLLQFHMEMPVLKVPLNPNQPSHRNAPAWRGYSVNTAVLSKERLSIDETTIQDLRLVKQANQLHGGCTDVPVIYQVIKCSMTGALEVCEVSGQWKADSCPRSRMEKGSWTDCRGYWEPCEPWHCIK